MRGTTLSAYRDGGFRQGPGDLSFPGHCVLFLKGVPEFLQSLRPTRRRSQQGWCQVWFLRRDGTVRVCICKSHGRLVAMRGVAAASTVRIGAVTLLLDTFPRTSRIRMN